MRNNLNKHGKRLLKKYNKKKLIIASVIALVIVMLILIILLIWYFVSISPVDKKNQEEIEIVIPFDTDASKIAEILENNGVIRNKVVFKIYIKIHKITNLQAGTYHLRQNMNLKEITKSLGRGIDQISLTYLEGKDIRWLANRISELTDNSPEDVYNLLDDENYINSLIEKYWFLTDEIKNENIYYTLEGYLFPDTYMINRNTTVDKIFEKMLDKMENILEEYRNEIEKSKYNIHEILTIASIIEMESMQDENRKDVSSVIYNRLNYGMAIQSDVTTYYGLRLDIRERNLTQEEINLYNPYNTRGPNMQGKLPVGPISSSSKKSIEVALNPNDTNYLFFVADKNGKLYFTRTDEEHRQVIKNLKNEGLWFEY